VLGFQLSQSTWEYGSGIGHLGASDHLVSLHHLLATGQLSPGDHVLLSGSGPGLTFKSAVVQILNVRGGSAPAELINPETQKDLGHRTWTLA
jgi:3-oxoacyl-[acyl-carrier-protein] synthase-3/clorobiocin biosynthesis protein CloN2